MLVRTEHFNLLGILEKNDLSPNQRRWITKLFPFHIEVKHIQGSSNWAANFLPRNSWNKKINIIVNTTRFSYNVDKTGFRPDYANDKDWSEIVMELTSHPG